MKSWGGRASQALVALTLAEFGATCWLRWDSKCTKVATTADHVIPRSRGGPDALDNLRPACLHCNSARGDRPWPGSAAIVPLNDLEFFRGAHTGSPAQPPPSQIGRAHV